MKTDKQIDPINPILSERGARRLVKFHKTRKPQFYTVTVRGELKAVICKGPFIGWDLHQAPDPKASLAARPRAGRYFPTLIRGGFPQLFSAREHVVRMIQTGQDLTATQHGTRQGSSRPA